MKGLTIFFAIITSLSHAQSILPGWHEGYLDIHHISTGSGNATLFIFPDGTTLLFDAGEVDRKARMGTPNPLKISPHLPHDSISAGRGIARYAKGVLPSISSIDYAIISHFHSDHYGSVAPQSKLSTRGDYYLSGISEVNDFLPIHQLIDRNYPLYNYPVDLKANVFDKKSFENYLKFVNSQVTKKTLLASALVPGSKTQIRLKINPVKYPTFFVQNIKSNGDVWLGTGTSFAHLMPPSIPLSEYNENPLSIALKVTYGRFDYFTGGDMTGLQGFGLPSWYDMETPVARVVGKVEALTLNHHGVRDASNEAFMRTLSPLVIVQQSWSSNHPGEEVLHRIISPYTYPGKRDIFATYIHEETIATYGHWLEENYRSKHGHIVIRVSPGGDEFYVHILDDAAINPQVIKTFGPYASN